MILPRAQVDTREQRWGENVIKSSLDLLNCKNHPSYIYIYICQSVGPICFFNGFTPHYCFGKASMFNNPYTSHTPNLKSSLWKLSLPTGEPQVMNLIGGLEHGFYFPILYIGNSHPNWRTHIFRRVWSTTNQTRSSHLAEFSSLGWRWTILIAGHEFQLCSGPREFSQIYDW